MSEVLIDDLSLNKIANSIRAKNGLVRTYKPREMAPAIQAFRNYIPTPHEYNVTINQTPHQQITVRRFLETNRNNHIGTFTVAEPYYTLDISLQTDFGYKAGTLNCGNPVILDRDMIIEATPAIYDPDNTGITTVYINGYQDGGDSQTTWHLFWYYDDDCTQTCWKNNVSGRIKIMYSDVPPSSGGRFKFGGRGFLGSENDNQDYRFAYSATEVELPLIDTSDFNSMRSFARRCYNLRKLYNLENWNMSNVSTMERCFQGCEQLRSVNIANWNTSSLVYTKWMFRDCYVLRTLDLSGWNTQNLMYCEEIFSGCNSLEVIDVSGWDTTSLRTNFPLPNNLKYLIMDKEEIMFVDNGKCTKPNNFIKYLVPSDMVLEYKAHPDWSAKADNIFSVDDFNIVRNNGEVFVTPNE